MIECIIRIPTNLQLNILPDGKSLAKGQVRCGEAGPSELVPMLVAEGSRCWSCEGGLVEPLMDPAVRQIRITDDIWIKSEVTARQRVGGVGSHYRRERLATLDHQSI